MHKEQLSWLVQERDQLADHQLTLALRLLGEGEGCLDPPPAVFVYLISNHFGTLSENFVPRSPQVRSPGQVQ